MEYDAGTHGNGPWAGVAQSFLDSLSGWCRRTVSECVGCSRSRMARVAHADALCAVEARNDLYS
ncbi:hypothetical protein Bsp3421_001611 [Burkholderia sp. FERM BP-3421]|uniref:hypothetical protein n=1 Tax=Burkholderia sp. FERM BP-3421 TaxID=1494466 RepID=UPI00235FE4FD|nr:hypothetical protein [Burkholderia sp. FERM BP-3421]WDD91671.1 hypothetical protein Bsp3421_001611 [Burkholderia sp. FERM BP-3421]